MSRHRPNPTDIYSVGCLSYQLGAVRKGGSCGSLSWPRLASDLALSQARYESDNRGFPQLVNVAAVDQLSAATRRAVNK